VGTAVSYIPLRDAQQAGYHIATLQASRLGFRVYEQFGFVEICTFDICVQRGFYSYGFIFSNQELSEDEIKGWEDDSDYDEDDFGIDMMDFGDK